MNQETIDRLKVAVNQFYLNTQMDKPLMSDEEFDKLRYEYETEYGKSVKDLVDWVHGMESINDPLPPLEKIQVTDNDLVKAIQNYTESIDFQKFYLNYKYDGSSIKAYYKNGRLYKILGTPDEEYGIVRTESFWNLFPHEVDSSIKSIQGEVLVDASVYGELARNAANGLTNSKYKESEVESEAFIRVYRIEFVDGEFNWDRHVEVLDNLPKIYKNRYRLSTDQSTEESTKVKHTDLVFAPAQRLRFDQVPTEAIIGEDDVKFQVDGIVLYGKSENNQVWTQGFKFYYTQSAVTTVKEIQWNQKENGSWASVVVFEPVTLNDKYIQKASTNGVPKMIDLQCGVGSKIKVILANTTIPKIIEVIEPSDKFNFPKCPCGYQMTENDICGSTLKCGNTDSCSDKTNKWIYELARWIIEDELFKDCKTVKECIDTCPQWFAYELHIDRWNPMTNFIPKNDTEKCAEELYEAISNFSRSQFRTWVEKYFYISSDLQWYMLDINIASAFTVLRSLHDKSLEELKLLINI